LKLQSVLCARTRSHVWHMKVLLYAVFKVRGLANRASAIAVPSKLNSAVPTNDPASGPIVLRETLARAAQPKLKNFGLVALIHPLAINGRVNP